MLNVLRVVRGYSFGLIIVLAAFFLLDVLCAFDFLYIFPALFLLGLTMVFGFQAVLSLRFCLALIVFPVVFGDFVVLFAEFGLVFESFCVSQRIEAVVCGRTPWRNAGNHDNFARLMLINEGVPKNKSEFGGPKRHVVCLVVHSPDALLQGQKAE